MRKTWVLVLGILVAGIALTSCAIEGSSTVEGNLTIPNSLGFGSDDDGILVQFLRVDHDSRCPEGVQCVDAGSAAVVISTLVDGEHTDGITLTMRPNGQAFFEVDRFTVTLLELKPNPPPQGGVPEEEYELTLRIED